MVSLSSARQIIAEKVKALSSQKVSLAEARGCVLAEDVIADAFYPSGDRSQMDGYAVRADAVPGDFRLAGEVAAGEEPVGEILPGETFRVFTGALLPKSAGRVVMQEDARIDGNIISFAEFGERRFIRAKGSEAVPGKIVMPAGTVLGPPEIAILAQVGAVFPTVVRKPKVHHVATGHELVDPAETPAPGQIRDTNSSLLKALFEELGCHDFSSRRVTDDLLAMVRAAESDADLLILSGGASVGDYDFGAKALREMGYEIHFDRVNIRPGKPLTFATRGSQVAFLLPGNPVSHFVCFHTAVRLAVELLAGHPPSWPAAWLELAGGEALSPDPRETWWPARAVVCEGRIQVAPKRWSTSGDTFSLVGTNALALVNAESPANGRVLTLLLAPPAL